MKKLKTGQFWRDTVNGDLLRILSFSQEPNANLAPGIEGVGGYVEYAKCACMVDGVYFGIQEMKTSHFETGRFQKPNSFMQFWYWRKFRTLLPGAKSSSAR